MEGSSIIEFDGENTLVDASSTVDRNVHLSFHVAIDLVASALHEIGGNGRVVGDLLEVNRTPVDPALIGLAQNGIEGLVHCEIDEGTSHN